MTDSLSNDRPLPGTPVNLPLPPELAEAFGHHGGARYVAFLWSPDGDQLRFEDGRSAGSGASWTFLAYRRHRAVAPLLEGWNLGYSDQEAEHCLVLDRVQNRASVAPTAAARAFLRAQHPPTYEPTPEEAEALRRRVEELTDGGWREVRVDPGQVRRLLEEQRQRVGRMVSWLDMCPTPAEGREP